MLCYIVAIYAKSKSKLPYNTDILEKTIISIIKVFEKLIIILKDKIVEKTIFQNGESVPKVGLVRFYLFNLFRDLLSLNQ